MHRLIREHLEELLADPLSASRPEQGPVSEHLAACDECRGELTAIR